MTSCLFTSDLHGHQDRYEKLFDVISSESPSAVFLGGDLLPSGIASLCSMAPSHSDFVNSYLVPCLTDLKQHLAESYPRIFVILGNDDPRFEEAAVLDAAARGVWEYIHNGKRPFCDYTVYGYACVPPTPFMLKDWERYDVSRYVDPGCVAPDEGALSFPATDDLQWTTIQGDIERLTSNAQLEKAVFLFHTPPYNTSLDRAALDGKMIDHVPLDVHVGSIAVQRFIEERQPLLTLHGHVHESARITGNWRARIGSTHAFSGAHDGPELALIRFDLEDLDGATRELI